MSKKHSFVDQIIAKRIGTDGKTEYLVKWEDRDHRASTWEQMDVFPNPLNIKSGEKVVPRSGRKKYKQKQKKPKFLLSEIIEKIHKRRAEKTLQSLPEFSAIDEKESSIEEWIGSAKRKTKKTSNCPSTQSSNCPSTQTSEQL